MQSDGSHHQLVLWPSVLPSSQVGQLLLQAEKLIRSQIDCGRRPDFENPESKLCHYWLGELVKRVAALMPRC